MRNGLITNSQGHRRWYQNDQLHRIDGPAIEYADGNKLWYQNDQRHRIDGPAVEYAEGDKFWYQNNQLHRTDGPAIELENGDKHWYIRGVRYDLNDWLELVDFTEVQKTVMRLQYA
jgi:hypothetical protein